MSLLQLTPHTGRQHQLRVQCLEQLHAGILGDPLYGPFLTPVVHTALHAQLPAAAMRMHLHAYQLVIPGYAGGKTPLTITAPLPSHMKITLSVLGLAAKGAYE